MGAITVHEFVSLDGVFEDPQWTFPFGFTEQMGHDLTDITSASSAILLGRRTWEMFWPAWSTRTAADDPGAPFFNESPKHVVTTTLSSTDDWQNSTIFGGYDAQAIRDLKDQTDGNIYISGSGTLVRALIADGLIDELHLLIYPVVLGAGARLFPDGTPQTTLKLAAQNTYENGVIHATYAPA
jgi:dihydrofolate reductase